MTDELNCTQITEPFPLPGTDEAGNSTIPWLITTVVTFYRPIHYYLFVSIVIFGVFANFMILLVLSKKEMRSAGVNVTMMCIAFCDFSCSISAVAQLFLRITDTYDSYINAYAQVTVDYLAVAFHASSLYLAVGMAFCRVMSLNLDNKNRDLWQSPKYALYVALALCAPVFVVASFVLFLHDVKEDEEGIYLDISDFSLENNCIFLKVSLIAAGSCFKALPCIMMLFFSLFLLGKIEEGKQSSVSVVSNRKDKSEKMDRSSRFIQFILVVFLVTESPQALFSIIGGVFLIDYLNYFQNLSIIMNVLAFINTTTSFIIYSALSSKFRRLFTQIFLPRSITDKMYRKWSTVVVQPSTTANASRTF